MPRVRTLTKADFVEVATKFVDENSLNDLTMRVLGDLLGVDATACYRHFPSKGALLAAMVDALFLSILEAVPDGGTPRDRLEAQMLASRRAFVAHPQIAAAMALSEGDTPAALQLMESAISTLEEMGLSGDNLVRGYQTLESYSVGSSIFDMARAPENMMIRRARYRLLENPAFDAVARSEKSVSETTEKAYELGMHALIDYVESLAD
jgi:TetR/AcrR family tetracycline transcriptional repressor